MEVKRIAEDWRVPDTLWERIEPLLPKKRRRTRGRPRIPLRQVLDGIFYVLRTGCQWKAAPREFGSGSTLHRYFQRWVRKGVFQKLWKEGLSEYDELVGIDWQWQSIDGAMTKAPLGGGKYGSKPHRSREIGNEAVPAYRRRRRATWPGSQRSQHARQATR